MKPDFIFIFLINSAVFRLLRRRFTFYFRKRASWKVNAACADPKWKEFAPGVLERAQQRVDRNRNWVEHGQHMAFKCLLISKLALWRALKFDGIGVCALLACVYMLVDTTQWSAQTKAIHRNGLFVYYYAVHAIIRRQNGGLMSRYESVSE